MSVDLLLRGGHVVDGTGRAPFRADVGVLGDRVVWVGSGAPEAGTVLDVTGRYVMPGFVDTHSHVDGVRDRPEVALALLRQGVTTVIIGQDGLGYAPAGPSAQAAAEEYFGILDGPLPAEPPQTIAELLDGARGPVNLATLVPLGLVWLDKCGPQRPAGLSDDRLAALVKAVERGLEDGAAGVSTGLEYVPNGFAAVRELTALCRPAAAAGLPHVTHMRGYELAAKAAFAEVAEVSRGSGAKLHVSHYRGPADLLTALADGAASDGVDLTYDTYPYVQGCTILAMRVLPSEVGAGTQRDVLDRLGRADVRASLLRSWRPEDLAPLRISATAGASWSSWEGRTVGECAEQLGKPVGEIVLDLLIECRLQVSVLLPQPATSGPEDMRRLLNRPEHMAGSDAIYTGSAPHPRGWGTFARLLGQHVRELGDWTWGQAALHLAGRPSARFGLLDRGTVRPGAIADLAVVDPATVRDEATYQDPRRPAVGVDDVLVAGIRVLSGGALTGAVPGRGLRARS